MDRGGSPPLSAPLDPTTKILIRTEVGHEIELDDLAKSITDQDATGHQVELRSGGPSRWPPPRDTASIKLDQAGDVTIEATDVAHPQGQASQIEGTGQVELESSGNVSVNGGTTCQVKASTILLN